MVTFKNNKRCSDYKKMRFFKKLSLMGLLFLAGCSSDNSKFISNNSFIHNNSSFVSSSNSNSGFRNSTSENRGANIRSNVPRVSRAVYSEIKLGVAGDIHNRHEKAAKIAEKFSELNVDCIILTGDYSKSYLDYMFTSEREGLIKALTPFLKTGKPVCTVPGNHEGKGVYLDTIKDLQKEYRNLLDISGGSCVDLNGVNLIGFGTGGLILPGGFSLKQEIKSLDEKIFSIDNDPVLIVSHMPPKFKHYEAIDSFFSLKLENGKTVWYPMEVEDVIYRGEKAEKINLSHKGEKELTDLIVKHNIKFGAFANFHPSYGANDLEKNIPEGKYSQSLFVNPGAVRYGRAAVLTIRGRQAKYEKIDIDSPSGYFARNQFQTKL